MKNFRLPGLTLVAILLTASFAFGGPVILGGDDLTDHGSFSGTVNLQGWLYIEKAIGGILAGSTRPGATANTIAALGSASASGGAGDAIASAAAELTPPATVTYYDGGPAVTGFFSSLASGATNPAMIWIAGNGAGNDIDSSEGAVLTANATAIAAYVGSGGGLMSHGSGPDVYGWLAVLIPGIVEGGSCNSSGATLTPAGTAAFPGLSNSDIDSNAGPCHSSFSGNLGSLQVLALDGSSPRVPYIIGGGSGTVIGGGADVPTLSGWMLILLGVLLSGTAVFVLNRRA
ncbi:MAG: hypothetical protein ACREDF_00140 [Thermoplasmata archaeon]